MATADMQRCTFAVIGGGIAGVTCAETLCHLTEGKSDTVILISSSPLIKAVINHQQIGHTMEYMDVSEAASETLSGRFDNLSVIHAKVTKLDTDSKRLYLSHGYTVCYEKVCIATGGAPKFLSSNDHVLSIRDTESVQQLQKKLAMAKRILVIGNGGIATELVYEVQSCEVIWCIKHKSISAAFFDESAAQFFLPHIQESGDRQNKPYTTRWKYSTEQSRLTCSCRCNQSDDSERGNALGPDWANSFPMSGASQSSLEKVQMKFEVEVERILTPDEFSNLQSISEATGSTKLWPVYAKLTNGKIYGADMIINATGVEPKYGFTLTDNQKLKYDAADGGIIIDMEMKSSCSHVYAAGDIVSTSQWANTEQWFQMRLWTQAKQMGHYAAKCMYNHFHKQPVYTDICFELFSHVTRFFGFKVVLLGLYNAQGLDVSKYKVLLRCNKGEEYIKAVVSEGRVIGAVLIGDTDMEETFENLILNKLDISRIEDSLLDPDIDIEDYFD